MQKLLRMPVLSSSAPSSIIWSQHYDYDQLPSDFDDLGYRLRSYGQFMVDKYTALTRESKDYKKAIGRLKVRLVEEWDQDHALILGQGTRTGLFQSIMAKPPNIRYVYPMTSAKRLEI